MGIRLKVSLGFLGVTWQLALMSLCGRSEEFGRLKEGPEGVGFGRFSLGGNVSGTAWDVVCFVEPGGFVVNDVARAF